MKRVKRMRISDFCKKRTFRMRQQLENVAKCTSIIQPVPEPKVSAKAICPRVS